MLEQAMAMLGARARRELRAVVEPLDQLLLRRTVHDPHADAGLPWWQRRA